MTYEDANEQAWADRGPCAYGSDDDALATLQWAEEHIERPIGSILDLGAGDGRFLRAAREIFPGTTLAAIDISPAYEPPLRAITDDVCILRITDYNPPQKYDLVLAMGLMCCLPDDTQREHAYERIGAACGRYLLVRDYLRGEGLMRWMEYRYLDDIPKAIPGMQIVSFCREKRTSDPESNIHWMLFELKK